MNLKQRVLVVAAHPDDEILGCGATMARIVADGGEVQTVFLADGESSRFQPSEIESPLVRGKIENRQANAVRAAAVLGTREPKFYEFPDNQLDTIALLSLIKIVETEVDRFQPSLVMTHFGSDLNIDHQRAQEAVIVATRPQQNTSVNMVLFFELPSSTEWRPPGSGNSFVPNLFVNVEGFTNLKFAALEAYEQEMRPFPHPRSREAIEALMRWRGASSGFMEAESFVLGRERI